MYCNILHPMLLVHIYDDLRIEFSYAFNCCNICSMAPLWGCFRLLMHACMDIYLESQVKNLYVNSLYPVLFLLCPGYEVTHWSRAPNGAAHGAHFLGDIPLVGIYAHALRD